MEWCGRVDECTVQARAAISIVRRRRTRQPPADAPRGASDCCSAHQPRQPTAQRRPLSGAAAVTSASRHLCVSESLPALRLGATFRPGAWQRQLEHRPQGVPAACKPFHHAARTVP
eukprot:355472-Chlamydomonas_euryale.AAC.8